MAWPGNEENKSNSSDNVKEKHNPQQDFEYPKGNIRSVVIPAEGVINLFWRSRKTKPFEQEA